MASELVDLGTRWNIHMEHYFISLLFRLVVRLSAISGFPFSPEWAREIICPRPCVDRLS